MTFEILFSDEAADSYEGLRNDPSQERHLKAVQKCLGCMETNLRHPSLNTHKYHSLKGPNGEDVFESYAQNRTPSAYRVLWYYGQKRGTIAVFAIVPHP